MKSEGRYKDADYVALTTRAYRQAVDDAWAGRASRLSAMDELQLEQVYSRGLGAHFLSGVNHRTVVRGRGPRVRIKELIPLVNTRVALTTLIAIRVRLQENGHDPVAELHELFERKPDDAQVRLRLEAPRDFSAILDLAQKVRPDREFRKMVERIRLTGDAPPPRSSLCPMQSGELTCSETIP